MSLLAMKEPFKPDGSEETWSLFKDSSHPSANGQVFPQPEWLAVEMHVFLLLLAACTWSLCAFATPCAIHIPLTVSQNAHGLRSIMWVHHSTPISTLGVGRRSHLSYSVVCAVDFLELQRS